MVLKTPILPVVSTIVVLLVLMERPAEAYIDPGTASYAFQIIAGALLGGVFLLRTFWTRIVTTVRGLVSRDVARGH
jgi:hypothetical protein